MRILVDIRDGDFQGGKYPGMLLPGFGMTPCIFDDVQAPLPQHYTVGLPTGVPTQASFAGGDLLSRPH